MKNTKLWIPTALSLISAALVAAGFPVLAENTAAQSEDPITQVTTDDSLETTLSIDFETDLDQIDQDSVDMTYQNIVALEYGNDLIMNTPYDFYQNEKQYASADSFIQYSTTSQQVYTTTRLSGMALHVASDNAADNMISSISSVTVVTSTDASELETSPVETSAEATTKSDEAEASTAPATEENQTTTTAPATTAPSTTTPTTTKAPTTTTPQTTTPTTTKDPYEAEGDDKAYAQYQASIAASQEAQQQHDASVAASQQAQQEAQVQASIAASQAAQQQYEASVAASQQAQQEAEVQASIAASQAAQQQYEASVAASQQAQAAYDASVAASQAAQQQYEASVAASQQAQQEYDISVAASQAAAEAMKPVDHSAEVKDTILAKLNEYRASLGLGGCYIDESLQSYAASYSLAMCEAGTAEHIWVCSSVNEWQGNTNYSYAAERAIEVFKSSPSHDSTITKPGLTGWGIGIGCSSNSTGTYITIVFSHN